MQANDVAGARGHAGDLVDVQRGCVGRENGAGLHDAIEIGEYLFLDIHVLEHRLNDQVAIGEALHVERALEPGHASLDLVLRKAALVGATLVVAPDDSESPVERFLLGLEDADLEPSRSKIHRNAAAHRAGADNADRLDRAPLCAGRDVRHFPSLAAGFGDIGGDLFGRHCSGLCHGCFLILVCCLVMAFVGQSPDAAPAPCLD